MSLLDRKSQKLSYSLGTTAKLWITVLTSLVLFQILVGWFFRGAALPSAREESDRAFPWTMLCVGFAVGGAALTGIRVVDRPEDRDS
jgi:hypothetical protein